MGVEAKPAGRSDSWKWWVCCLLLLATMINYMDRQTLSLTADPIYGEFGHDPAMYGYTESAFAVAFALGALLVGWSADRWTIFWIYPTTVAVWSLAGFATGFVQGWAGLMACRFLLGLAEAGHWPCALRTTQHLLPPHQRSLGNGIMQSGAAIGAILTPLLVLGLVGRPDEWRRPFWAIGALGLTWVCLWFVWLRPRDLPSFGDPSRAAQPDESARPVEAASFRYLADRRFWVLAVVVVSINIAWHYFRAWLPQVMGDSGYTHHDAVLFNSAYYIAADVGSIAVGFGTLGLARRLASVHRARVIMFVACTLLTMLGVVAAFLPKGPVLLGLLLVIAFGSLGLFPNYYSFQQEISVRNQGKVTGTLGFINWLAIALLQAGIGVSRDLTGSFVAGMIFASLAPAAGVVALVFFWREPTKKTV
jgi:ACS family hexuronate transporter-like MFS transporter